MVAFVEWSGELWVWWMWALSLVASRAVLEHRAVVVGGDRG